MTAADNRKARTFGAVPSGLFPARGAQGSPPHVNAPALTAVRTYETHRYPKLWNSGAALPVSMDIRTDQGHLGKVS